MADEMRTLVGNLFLARSGNRKSTFEDMAALAGRAPAAAPASANGEQGTGAHGAKVQESVGKLKA